MNTTKNDMFYGGLIYVCLIAFLMTLFELLFFKYILEPQEKEVFKNKMKKIGYVMQNIFNLNTVSQISMSSNVLKGIKGAVDDTVEDYFTVAKTREEILNKEINVGATIIISIELALFLALIVYSYKQLKEDSIIPILAHALITFVILGLFQYIMYIYAGGTGLPNTYNYAGNDELFYQIFQKLENDLKKP